MKNTIWIAKDKTDAVFEYQTRPVIDKDAPYRYILNIKDESHESPPERNIFNIKLEPMECVSVTIDTETQTFTVKRERKKGWYLCFASVPRCMYWDGANFIDGCGGVYSESLFVNIDETPLTSPFLKEVENE